MKIHIVAVLLLTLAASACRGGDARTPDPGIPSLVLVDSTVLQETDSSLIGTPIHLTVNRAGAMFVSDAMNSRVTEFARDGRFVRRFGARGDGPGEFRTPLASALLGDTILAVADAGSSRTSSKVIASPTIFVAGSYGFEIVWFSM